MGKVLVNSMYFIATSVWTDHRQDPWNYCCKIIVLFVKMIMMMMIIRKTCYYKCGENESCFSFTSYTTNKIQQKSLEIFNLKVFFFKLLTCLESCSSHSLYKVKNFLARVTLSIKPQLASFTRMMICRSGTIIATVRNWIFRFSGSSCLPA